MSCSPRTVDEDCDVPAIDPQQACAYDKTSFLVMRSRHRHPRPEPDGPVVCRSEAMQRVLAEVGQVASTASTVLLLGETGVGKEVVAQAIHDASPRRYRPMIRVSCAAIPTTLIESELFGHERGAFTGALARQVGRFEAANGSTLFLDEIGELPLETQVKLLRVLEARTIERLGSNAPTRIDVRVIAATNKNLEEAVAGNRFREDLFYRLNVFPITIPPLRERTADIPALAWSFIKDVSRSIGKQIDDINSQRLTALQHYTWPGNVRELRNVIERAVILSTSPTLEPTVPGARPFARDARRSERLADVQADHIRSVLVSSQWRIRGRRGAAERLGLKPTTLESRMARLGIRRHEGDLQ